MSDQIGGTHNRRGCLGWKGCALLVVLSIGTFLVLLYRWLFVAGEYHAERAPVWSPDGQHIAFQCYDGIVNPMIGIEYPIDGWEICVVNADGSGYTRLTDDDDEDRDPVWSPDGKRIAFFSSGGLDSVNRGLFVINADGGNPVQVAPRKGWQPTWSPDGRYIAYDDDASGDVVIVPVEGGSPVHLAHGCCPSWSPDSRRIAFISASEGDEASAEIHTIGVDGTNEVSLTHDGLTFVSSTTWSPDGRFIAFESKGRAPLSFDWTIWVMNADGTDLRQCTGRGRDFYDERDPLVWSPDSSRIAFAGRDHTEVGSTGGVAYYEIYVVDVDSGAQTRLTRVEEEIREVYKATGRLRGVRVNRPACSPDGRHIVFLKGRNDETAPLRLWIMNSDGSNPVKLISD